MLDISYCTGSWIPTVFHRIVPIPDDECIGILVEGELFTAFCADSDSHTALWEQIGSSDKHNRTVEKTEK